MLISKTKRVFGFTNGKAGTKAVSIQDGKIVEEGEKKPRNGLVFLPDSKHGVGPGSSGVKDKPSYAPSTLLRASEDKLSCAPSLPAELVDSEDKAAGHDDDGEVVQEESIGARKGRLPGEKRFFVHLRTAGKAKRTIQEYEYELAWWKTQAKECRKKPYFLKVHEIEQILVELHPATRQRKKAALRTYSRWLLRENHPRLYAEMEKLPSVKRPKSLPKDLGAKRFNELRNQAKQWIQNGKREGVWLGLMLMTGLRISEIQTAHKSGDYIKVMGKGEKERLVPVPKWLLEAMENIPRNGRRGWAKQRTVIWQGLAKQNILKPHSLRHTYATQLLRKGRRIEEIQVLLGHESIATTNIYARASVPRGIVADLDG